MCGIYGIVSRDKAAGEQVYEGLKRLEYRGYDSWGVVVTKNGHLAVHKQVGKIAVGKKPKLPAATVAIGHTRWATHGGVTQINAHPHLAKDGSFALVQNGVAENYQQLKQKLQSAGYKFVSETDTEVIVGVLETVMAARKEAEPSLDSVRAAFKQLSGRNTIAVLTQSGRIIAVRNGSPLVVGRNKQRELFICSDVLSLAAAADEYTLIEHGQGVVIDGAGAHFFVAKHGRQFRPHWQPIDVAAVKLDTEGFDHFMLKEIHEQSKVLTNVAEQPAEQLTKLVRALKTSDHIYVIGAGSASFIASTLAFLLRQQGLPAVELKSYEARSFRRLFTKHDLAIAISQSGETADTNEVIEWMRAEEVTVASIVNMPGSTLTAQSDLPFMLQVGPEVGVASTKALAGQITWGKLLVGLIRGQNLAVIKKRIGRYQQQLGEWLADRVIQQQLRQLAKKLDRHDRLFVLGRGELYPSALEFALKMKEISYIHAEGFSGGELKHGVIALIETGTPVVCLIANDDEKSDMLNAVAEVKARGAWTIGVTQESNSLFDDWIKLPDNDEFAAISSFIPAQLLTYHLAVLKGFDPDKPRNLAKSVTVK